jgi:hypothetical protein
MIGLRRYMGARAIGSKTEQSSDCECLKLSKETVGSDRNHNRQLYTEKLLASADVHRARLLKEQMELKDQALASFDKSKRKKVTTFQDNGGDGDNQKATVRIEETAGDSGFLSIAKNSLVEQARLLGLHELKPQENEDKSYRQFLQDLSKTIDKEKEDKSSRELKEGAISVEARDATEEPEASGISFEPEEEKELGPNGQALIDLPLNNY